MDWPFSGRERERRRAVATLLGPASGLIVTGPAYVGRTRFLREVAAALPEGRPAVLAPTRSSRGIPFAGLGGHAPPEHGSPDRWVAHLRSRLGADPILLVDDAQWLDDHSAQAIFELVRSGDATVLLAIRTGHRVPGAVTSLERDHDVGRVVLGPLDRPATEDLVAAALGGTVSPEARRALWSVSQGYPRLIHEFTDHAVEQGVLVHADGTWELAGPLTVPPRTVESVVEIMGELGDATARAVRLIAVGEPLDSDVLDRLVAPTTIARLERSGIAVQDPVSGRYRFPAPGACMAVREALVPAEVRELSRDLAAASEVDPRHLEGDDLVRHVGWRLAAREPVAPDTLLRAAAVATARFDHAGAERLARAALPGGGVPALLRLSSSLVSQDRVDEAEAALAEAAARSADDGERLQATIERAKLLVFRLGRSEPAIASLREATARAAPGPVRDDATMFLAMLISLEGDLSGSVQLSRPLVESPDTDPATRAMAACSLALALGMRGDLIRSKEVTRRVMERSHEPQLLRQPLAQHLLRATLMMGHLYLGELAQADELAVSSYEHALAAEADEIAGIWATQLAALRLFQGRIDEASGAAREARRRLRHADALSTLPLANALGAMAAAEGGDPAAAETWLQRVVTERRMADARAILLEGRAQTVLTAARGDLGAAARHAVVVGEQALGMEHRVWAVLSLYQAVRYGYPEQVVRHLGELRGELDGLLLTTMCDHARALVDEDVDALEQVSLGFGELGALLHAAEAAAQAARLAARAGSARRAAGLRTRTRSLLVRCPGAVSPAVSGLDGEPLTRREHEVALLAARGETSREIAERLYLSTRTIDNHLASVYRKLGVAGRDELPAALAVDAT